MTWGVKIQMFCNPLIQNLQKKRMRDAKFERKYPEVRSDFYLDIYDKSILLSRIKVDLIF